MNSAFGRDGRLLLTQAQAYRLYNDAFRDGRSDLPRDIIIHPTLEDLSQFGPSVSGSTDFASDNEASVRLSASMSGLNLDNNEHSRIVVSEDKLLNGVTTVYHELHHVRQRLFCMGKFSYPEFSKDVAVSLVASYQNDVYYHALHGRFLRELDAQAYSVKQAYAFLLNRYGSDAESVMQVAQRMLNYVNCNLGIKYQFPLPTGQTKFESMEDVLVALQDSYSCWDAPLPVHTYTGYQYVRPRAKQSEGVVKDAMSAVKGLFGKNSAKSALQEREQRYDEFAAAKMLSRQRSGPVFAAWHKMWDDFRYVDTMRDSCRILCAFSTYLHPEYLEKFLCLKDMQSELSVENCFTRYTGSEFPESRSVIFDNIKDACPFATKPRGLDKTRAVLQNAQSVLKQNRSVPEAAGIPPSCTPDYDSVERPAVRPQSCSGRSLCGLDVDPDNSNNVSNDFERS